MLGLPTIEVVTGVTHFNFAVIFVLFCVLRRIREGMPSWVRVRPGFNYDVSMFSG